MAFRTVRQKRGKKHTICRRGFCDVGDHQHDHGR
jgi:hypothetical protein